jgi:chromatin segregation and condensation protein Rec8/ScpA/Scc1 (kleisin family)
VPNYKKTNWEGIKQDLISSRDKFIAKLEAGTNMDTVEEIWKQFKEAIETCIEKHIPKKKIGKHHDVPWMTTDIKRLIRKKTTLIQQKQKKQETITQKSFQRHQKLN